VIIIYSFFPLVLDVTGWDSYDDLVFIGPKHLRCSPNNYCLDNEDTGHLA
jgi:hypothetical protein